MALTLLDYSGTEIPEMGLDKLTLLEPGEELISKPRPDISQLDLIGEGLITDKLPIAPQLDLASSTIKDFEGFRSEAYLPTKEDIPTIGYGQTKGIKMGQTITEEEADVDLKGEVNKISKQLDDVVDIDLNNNQRSALISLIYNVGMPSFKKSDALKALNAGDYDKFKERAFGEEGWIKQKGKVLGGLVERRDKEKVLFDTPEIIPEVVRVKPEIKVPIKEEISKPKVGISLLSLEGERTGKLLDIPIKREITKFPFTETIPTEGVDPRIFEMESELLGRKPKEDIPEFRPPGIYPEEDLGFFGDIVNRVKQQMRMSPEQASNILALSETLGLPPHETQKRYRELTRELADQPEAMEIAEGLMTLGIGAGLLAHPVATILTLGGFIAIDQLGNLENLAPVDASVQTEELLGIADFMLKGAVIGVGAGIAKTRLGVKELSYKELKSSLERLRAKPEDIQAKTDVAENLNNIYKEETEIVGIIKELNRAEEAKIEPKVTPEEVRIARVRFKERRVKRLAVELVEPVVPEVVKPEIVEPVEPITGVPITEPIKPELKIKPEVKPVIDIKPEMLPKDKRLHGTSTKIKNLEDYTYGPENIYGQGLYTTDKPDIAVLYTKKGKGKTPTVYEITEKKKIKNFDLERPVKDIKESDLLSFMDELKEYLPEDMDVANTPIAEVFDTFRSEAKEAGWSSDRMQEFLEDFQLKLIDKNYDSISHVGGKIIGTEPHNVKIYLKPKESIKIKEVKPEVKPKVKPEVEPKPVEPEMLPSKFERSIDEIADDIFGMIEKEPIRPERIPDVKPEVKPIELDIENLRGRETQLLRQYQEAKLEQFESHADYTRFIDETEKALGNVRKEIRKHPDKDLYEEELSTFEEEPTVLEDFLTLVKTNPNTLGTGLGPIGEMTPEKIQALERLKRRVSIIKKAADKSGKDVKTYLMDLKTPEDVAEGIAKHAEKDLISPEVPEDIIIDPDVAEMDKELVNEDLKVFNSLMSKLDVEYPFKKLKLNELGFQVKNYFTNRTFFEEQGVSIVKKLTKLNLSVEDYTNVALLRERSIKLEDIPPKVRAKTKKAFEIVDKYLENSFAEYKKEGGLEEPFPKSYIMRLKNQNKLLQEKLDKKIGNTEKINSTIDSNNKAIRVLEKTRYVPIMRAWFDTLSKKDPVNFRRMVSIAAHKKRKILTLKELVDNGFVSDKEADIRNIIGYYARRKGKDIASLRIRNAGVKEGVIKPVKDKVKNWTQFAHQRFPVFKGYKVMPGVDNYLNDFLLSQGQQNFIGKALGVTKGLQFINPVIMPMYNLYQSGMLGTIRSLKGPSAFKSALKSIHKQDIHYIKAFEDGLFSQPFNNPLNSYNNMIRLAKLPLVEKTFELINPFTIKNPAWTKTLYNASWSTAWHLDRAIRMSSYHYLLDKGMTSREAAQLAALYHSDYASVPPAMRRSLNKLFFTPTFKITMTKLLAETVLSPIEIAKEWKKTGGISKKTKIAFGALLAATAFNVGRDMLMTSQGFKRDEWGRKYSKEVDTDEGLRELVLTFSDPTNMHLKYLYRAMNAIKPGGDTAWWSFIRANKHEFHPLWRILAFDLAENRTSAGKLIYSPGDDKSLKALKIARYLTGQIVRMVGVMDPHEDDPKTKKVLQQEFGKITSKLISPVTFAYVRKTIGERNNRKIQRIKKQMIRDAHEETLTENNTENYQKQIDSLVKEIEERD